jgi:hypothetical protein
VTRNNRRRAVTALVLLLAGAGAATAAFRRVVRPRRISTDTLAGPPDAQPDTQAEPAVAVDPRDPRIVVAVFQQGRFSDGGSVDPGFATSHDGGLTWVAGNLPGLTFAVGGTFERASDPAVAIGPDGTVYAQTLPLSFSGNDGIAVQRSEDAGLTFEPPVLVQEDPCCLNDKNWIAADTFPGSPHSGRVYSVWTRGDTTVLRYSDDRATSWSDLVTVSAASGVPGAYGPLPLVQPNGDVTVVYHAIGPNVDAIVSQTSHDGGSTFDASVPIGAFLSQEVAGMRTGNGLPGAAVDPVTGRLYAVWPDQSRRDDGLHDIAVAVSRDGAVSWEAPLIVNTHAGRRTERFTPTVAAYGGFLHLTYRTRHATRLGFTPGVGMRYVVSTDDGATFSPERRLGRKGRVEFAAISRGAFLGDYMGLAASSGAVHAVWCLPLRSRRSPSHQTTWGATILRAVPSVNAISGLTGGDDAPGHGCGASSIVGPLTCR